MSELSVILKEGKRRMQERSSFRQDVLRKMLEDFPRRARELKKPPSTTVRVGDQRLAAWFAGWSGGSEPMGEFTEGDAYGRRMFVDETGQLYMEIIWFFRRPRPVESFSPIAVEELIEHIGGLQ